MSQASDSTLLYSRPRDGMPASAGRRPVPPGESRRVIPSGDVSPDGRRAYPRSSMTTKVLVLGGLGLAAAAATAGGVYLFAHEASATRYIDKHTQRLGSFGVTGAEFTVLEVNEALSRMDHAVLERS